MNFVYSPRYKFDSVALIWYIWLGKFCSVRLYQLNKPKTSYAFHTIKIRLAMVDISPTNISFSHGISGRLAGGCLGSYLGCMKLIIQLCFSTIKI